MKVKLPMKYIILALIVCVIGIGVYFYFPWPGFLQRQSSTTILTTLQKTREIDRLYTGVYYIPVIDKEYGFKKRDMLKEAAKTYFNPMQWIEKGKRLLNDQPLMDESKDDVKKVLKGACLKKYEVAFGYDHLMQILQNSELIAQVCRKNYSAIPAPQILAVNCKTTENKGKYDSSGACYGWDSNGDERKRILNERLLEDGMLEKINRRGKDSLKNFLMAFCD